MQNLYDMQATGFLKFYLLTASPTHQSGVVSNNLLLPHYRDSFSSSAAEHLHFLLLVAVRQRIGVLVVDQGMIAITPGESLGSLPQSSFLVFRNPILTTIYQI